MTDQPDQPEQIKIFNRCTEWLRGEGQACDELLHGGEGQLRLFAPRAALIESGGATARVWVVSNRRGSRARVRLREVGLGAQRIGDAVEVLSGLQLGDELVVSPASTLEENARVELSGESGGIQ